MADYVAPKIVNVEGSDAHKSQERRHTVNASSSFPLSREVLCHRFSSQINSELVFVIISLFLKLV